MPNRFLQVIQLKKTFDAQVAAVQNVSFALMRDEILCLLGPSGCGKTTLLRMIAGLEIPDSGEIRQGDRNIAAVAAHKRGFGMMFQDFALFPHKNVFENVAFGLRMQRMSNLEIANRVAEMLALVNLKGLESRDISLLSGGEQQRVALARALAPKPPLLMLDEPLGALDRALREHLMLELRHILKQVGVSAIYVTHDQAEAFAVADRVAVMNAGRIEQLAPPRVVYRQPATEFVARFLGFANIVYGPVIDGKVQTALGMLPCPTATNRPTATLLIRPDAIQTGEAALSGDIVLQGRVTAVSFRGRYDRVDIDCHGQHLQFETVPDAYRLGQTVKFGLHPTKIQLLK